MRKCIRCGADMKENCGIKIEGGVHGIVLLSSENTMYGGLLGHGLGTPKVAICPKCGEVSIYLENLAKLR